MIHSIKINIPANADYENLYDSIESAFNQNHYKVERIGGQLTFERLTTQNRGKFQLIVELYEGFTKGRIYIDHRVPGTLICKIEYYKQLVVSLILGLLVTFVFSTYTGSFWVLLFKLGFPVALLFLVIGIRSGNSMVENLLKKALNGNAFSNEYNHNI